MSFNVSAAAAKAHVRALAWANTHIGALSPSARPLRFHEPKSHRKLKIATREKRLIKTLKLAKTREK